MKYRFLYFITFLYFLLVNKSWSECPKFNYKEYNFSDVIPQQNLKSNYNDVKSFTKYIDNILIFGRFVFVNNSYSSIKILQPLNDNKGCDKRMSAKTSDTARNGNNCEIAINAGFFDTGNKNCIGNLINNGIVYRNTGGIINANFGVKKNGDLFFGYLGAAEVNSSDFESLVGGVVWLLRNGKSVVNESIDQECKDSQNTGNLKYFAEVRSARTAVGATADGTVVLVHVEGKTESGGVNLETLAKLLSELGVVSAINLDGGGSSTMVINGTLVSYPSDECHRNIFSCERPVSTVLCVSTRCPNQCSSGKECRHGYCQDPAYAVTYSHQNESLMAVGIGIGAVIVVLLLTLLLFVAFQKRKIRRRLSRDESQPRLVFKEEDDFIHFDVEPLMQSQEEF